MLGRFGAQPLDVIARRIGFEERVIDEAGDRRRCPAGGVDAEPRRASLEYARQPGGTALVQHGVAGAALPRRPIDRTDFLGDEGDQPRQVDRLHVKRIRRH